MRRAGETWPGTVLALGAALAMLSFASGMIQAWLAPVFDHATGSVLVLASDLLEGDFYRLPLGPSGFGGTRYFPLFPALVAVLKLAGLSFVGACFVVNAVSSALLWVGVRQVLGSLGLAPRQATVWASLTFASAAVWTCMAEYRMDLFPLMLVVWGTRFTLAVRSRTGDGWSGPLLAAALCFFAAITAKVTAGAWVAGAGACLFFDRRPGLTLRLWGLVAVLLVVFLAGMQLGTDGRFLTVLRECAGGGGGGIKLLLKAPLTLDDRVRHLDPLCFMLTAFALLAWLQRPWREGRDLPSCLLLAVLVAELAIYATPGTVQNHLVDLHVAALLVVATAVASGRLPTQFLALVQSFYLVVTTYGLNRTYATSDAPRDRAAAAEYLKAFPAPVLSEQPALPLQLGQTPYLADAFMLRVLSLKNPPFARQVEAKLEAREFSVFVASRPIEPIWYDEIHFGKGFYDALQANYVVDKVIGAYTFFVPRPPGT